MKSDPPRYRLFVFSLSLCVVMLQGACETVGVTAGNLRPKEITAAEGHGIPRLLHSGGLRKFAYCGLEAGAAR